MLTTLDIVRNVYLINVLCQLHTLLAPLNHFKLLTQSLTKYTFRFIIIIEADEIIPRYLL